MICISLIYISANSNYNVESLLVTTWFLCVLGFLTGFLGPIIVAINISVIIYKLSNFQPIAINEFVFIWDLIYEILNISNEYIRIFIFALTTLFGARETIKFSLGDLAT